MSAWPKDTKDELTESNPHNLVVTEQDSVTIRIIVRDKTGQTMDLTPFQVVFAVKDKLTSPDSAAKITKGTAGLTHGSDSQLKILDQTDPTLRGVLEIYLAPNDTELLPRDYLYTVKLLTIPPEAPKRFTVVTALFRIVKSLLETVA
jgi:hypothetical protein